MVSRIVEQLSAQLQGHAVLIVFPQIFARLHYVCAVRGAMRSNISSGSCEHKQRETIILRSVLFINY
jgi:hypothetical protein